MKKGENMKLRKSPRRREKQLNKMQKYIKEITGTVMFVVYSIYFIPRILFGFLTTNDIVIAFAIYGIALILMGYNKVGNSLIAKR